MASHPARPSYGARQTADSNPFFTGKLAWFNQFLASEE